MKTIRFSKRLRIYMDLAVLTTAFLLTYLLRYDLNIPQIQLHNLLLQLPYVVTIQIAALYLFGCRKFVALSDLQNFFKFAVFSALPVMLFGMVLPRSISQLKVPLSVTIMDAVLGLVGILGIRLFHQILYESTKNEKVADDDKANHDGESLTTRALHLDEEGIRRFLTGRSVMITGAGGSIGAELARQAARFRPSSLLLVERAEYPLLQIDRELRESMKELSIVPLLTDISDSRRMSSIFSVYNPQVVLHAAAYKQISMMELNLIEAIKNNALATFRLGELAGTCGIEKFILISTNNAAHPTSVMGASKRLAELAIQCLNQRSYTRYLAVRFGNLSEVSGARVSDATQLVLQAGCLETVGEVFSLNLGEDEESRFSEDQLTRTSHPLIYLENTVAYSTEKVNYALQQLTEMAQAGQVKELRSYLNDLLPDARLEPSEDRPLCGDQRRMALLSE
jgi:FlaA1/EpsC-like NDP-sugar epimerase